MSSDPSEFIDQLLALPVEQRADIVSILIRSMDRPPGETLTRQQWEQEICRRSDELKSGSAQLIGADVSLADARARIAAAKKP